MSKRDVSIEGIDINGDNQDIGGKGSEEGAEDGEEIIQIFEIRWLNW